MSQITDKCDEIASKLSDTSAKVAQIKSAAIAKDESDAQEAADKLASLQTLLQSADSLDAAVTSQL